MKNIFRKAITVLGSAALIGSTIGMAAAAAYPVPFVENGAANVAIVTGANAAISDVVGAANLASDLATALAAQTASGGTGATVSGDAWLAGTSSDLLEVGEAIASTDTYIDSEDLGILADGTIVNSKGTATYEQNLYFEDVVSSMVNYTTNDDDVVADFFQIEGGKVIAKYVMDFSKTLDTDVTSDVLEDIEDEEITILGKAYTITSATNASGDDVALTLISGADKATIASGEELTVGGYTISAVVSGTNIVQFTIDGTTLDKMGSGDIEPIPGTGAYIAATDVTYESFAGGLHQATFWIGADKLILKNGASLEVNGETINNAAVTITKTNTDDISISEIVVNMTADDDYFVPVGGKLSEQIEASKDDAGVLLGQNWDIEFAGYEAYETETISLSVSGSDKKYTLKFDNYLGNEVSLPLFYTNDSGIFAGDSVDKPLVFFANETGMNITKNDYFILNTADPSDVSKNTKTFVVQYKGADSRSDTSPEATFDVLGVEDGKQVSVDTAVGAVRGTRMTLKLGGSTFNFQNVSTAESDDFTIALTGDDNSVFGPGVSATAVSSASLYLRTQYNTMINITDGNVSLVTGADAAGRDGAPFYVNITVDDTNRDDDALTLPQTLLRVTYGNGTASDATATVTTLANAAISDPDNSDKSSYRTQYGALIEQSDGSSSPAEQVITVPDKILHPLMYVSAGEVTVNTGSTGGTATALGAVTVEDSEVASVASKNLIVVGGSCINSVAADLLGEAACGAAFTALTDVAAGEFLIESFDRSGKTALLVAGYNAEDTTKAVTYLTNTAVTTDVTTKLKGTSATEATVVTA
jgi:hypothetical protein